MNKPDNLQQINTNSPRETLVYADNDTVIKRPVRGAMQPQTWLEKQRHAQDVMNTLNKIGSKKYFVPQMTEILPDQMIAIETRAYGNPIKSSYFETLAPADQDLIYDAIAHFMNDINQSRPVLKQSQIFDNSDDEDNMSFDMVIEQLTKHITPEQVKIIQDARSWFNKASENDASVVFSHGDMNENNIFYDPQRRVVSFIDFADARYENIHYMFENDFGKLGWLDLDRIRREYAALPRTQPVVITTDPLVVNMRNGLQNIKWGAIDFLKSPKPVAKIRLSILGNDIEKIQKLYRQAQAIKQFAQGVRTVTATAANNTTPIPTTQHQK